VAFLVRVRYAFDEGTGAIDASTFSGIGINFTFDGLGHDDQSDHIHDEVRGPCLARGGNGGRSQPAYPGFLMTTGQLWTITMDIEGDSENGPVRVLVKLFAAGEPEPLQPFGALYLNDGQGPSPGPDQEHAFLAAALGGGSLEIHDLQICGIPDEERRVQSLTCQEQEDETVLVQWENPVGADLDARIQVLVAGEEQADLPGDATNAVLAGLPEGEVLISVVNYSGSAATCSVGESQPEAHFLRGDCTAEGEIDISDSIFLLSSLFSGGPTPGCLEACDVNSDHAADISDAVYGLGYLFLGGPAPGAPFPGCGHDHVEVGCAVEHCPHG
jgi:hypothetical protein